MKLYCSFINFIFFIGIFAISSATVPGFASSGEISRIGAGLTLVAAKSCRTQCRDQAGLCVQTRCRGGGGVFGGQCAKACERQLASCLSRCN